VVAIAALSTSFEKGFRDNAKEMLGADIAVRSSEAFAEGWDAALGEIEGSQWMLTREQPQSITPSGGGRTLIADLMVVGKDYPYYGNLNLRGAETLQAALSPERVVVGRDLISDLKVDIGDSLQIGDATFEIAGWAGTDPDRITGFMYIGPRIYMSEEAFARANVSDVRIGVRFKALVRLPDMAAEDLEGLKERIEASLESTMARARVETFLEGRPSLQDGLDRLARFLGLVALLSLLLGGVGVAQAVRAWISGRMDAIAVLKCLGMRPREIFLLYGAQALLLGLAGSVIGAALGLLFTALLPIVFSEFIPQGLVNPWQPRAALGGIALGIAVAAVFGFPPLFAVLRVPPIRVFRRDAEPLPAAKWAAVLTALLMVCGIATLAGFQARSALVGTIFALGVIVTGALLTLGAWILVKLVTKLPRGWGRSVTLRHGLAALARPGANTIPSIVALGLGLMVLFCAALVQEFLNQALTGSLPVRIPSAVAINIRPDQVDALGKTLAEAGAEDVQSAPLVMARLTAIDGTPVEELAGEGEDGERRRRRFRSEQTLTYNAELPANQKVIEGEWWHKADIGELSVERRQADRFDLEIGSRATFAVAGKDIELEVTSIRDVDWEEISLNFEWVAEPGYLEDLPQFRVATMWLPDGTGRETQSKVVSAFPNVTFLPLSDVAERVIAQLDRIGWGIRLLGLFIVAASMAVLAGTVGIDSNRRGREVALLKTVGMTRREVAAIFTAEYALIGLVAGLIGVTGGGVVAGLTLTRALDADFQWPFGMFTLAILGGIAITVIAGLAASIGALQRRPIEMLRHQE
jgi:putative ABC transport system permease protein